MAMLSRIFLLLILLGPATAWAQQWTVAEIYDRAGFVTKASRFRIDPAGAGVTGFVHGKLFKTALAQVDRIHNLGQDRLLIVYKNGVGTVVDQAEIRVVDESGRGRGYTCYKTWSRGEVNFYYQDMASGKEDLFTLCQANLAAVALGKPLT